MKERFMKSTVPGESTGPESREAYSLKVTPAGDLENSEHHHALLGSSCFSEVVWPPAI